jgi:hypothetical protein
MGETEERRVHSRRLCGQQKRTIGEWLEILPTQKLSKARTAEVERIDALLEAEQAGTARDGLQDNRICSTRLNDSFPVQYGADRVKRIDPPSCCRTNDGSNAGE